MFERFDEICHGNPTAIGFVADTLPSNILPLDAGHNDSLVPTMTTAKDGSFGAATDLISAGRNRASGNCAGWRFPHPLCRRVGVGRRSVLQHKRKYILTTYLCKKVALNAGRSRGSIYLTVIEVVLHEIKDGNLLGFNVHGLNLLFLITIRAYLRLPLT